VEHALMPKFQKIILVPGPGVGDGIFLISAVRELKKVQPNLTIDVLINENVSTELFLYNDDFNEIIINPPKKQIEKMRHHNYDFAIAFPVTDNSVSSLKRLGLKTFFPEYGSIPHANSVLKLIQFIFPECKNSKIEQYYIYPQEKHFKEATQILNSYDSNFNEKILIGCHIGYSAVANKSRKWSRRIRHNYGTKMWPVKNYVHLLNKLIQINPNIRFVLTGTRAETKLISKLFKHHKKYIYNISGQTSILTLTAMMQYFKCFISGDTGPAYLAAAMQTPRITLFPDKIYVGDIDMNPATNILLHAANMADITVDDVCQKTQNILAIMDS
jgi:ADP-heptose:LPS heptosyltransferase